MSLTAGMASVGEDGFTYLASGNMTGDWMSHGNLGQLAANEENLYVGGSYNMGDFSLSATMSTVTNTEDENYERSATDISVGYSLINIDCLGFFVPTDISGNS